MKNAVKKIPVFDLIITEKKSDVEPYYNYYLGDCYMFGVNEPFTKHDLENIYCNGYLDHFLGDNPYSIHKWSCSKCGRGVKELENYCPSCGLKMRKGGAV